MQQSSVKTIKLGGHLARRFGREHRFAVDSFPEGIRALSCQVPGFREYMNSYVGQRTRFAVFVDGRNVGEYDTDALLCAREIRLIPIPTVRKSGGLMQIVIGAVIMAAAFFTGGAALAAMGAFASAAFMAGGAMVLGGVMQMLSPQQGGMKFSSQSAQNKPSYAFGGAVNTTSAGYPVPLPYGYRTNGGAIWSAGSYAEDIS